MLESSPIPIGLCAHLACVLDVASYKPGNVNLVRGHDDMTFVDFLLSAAAIAPVMEQAAFQPIGVTILESIRATRRVTKVNTNLGIVLLLAPLASVPPNLDLKGGIIRSLIRLTVDDAVAAYEAIRLANPGGLGLVEQQDVAHAPTVTLREAMALAADRDMVARQYVNDFEQVFEGVEILREEIARHQPRVSTAITVLYLRLLAKYPDSLIARKKGLDVAREVSALAQRMLTSVSGPKLDLKSIYGQSLRLPPASEFGNPGTTADLVTACLFVAIRTGMIQLPFDPPFRTSLLD